MNGLPLHDRQIAPILAQAERLHGDRIYLQFGRESYSFAKTAELSQSLARGLIGQGMAHGSYVAVMLPNCSEFIFAWYATSLARIVMVPINTGYKGHMLDAPLRDTRCEGLIIHRDLLPALATVDEATRRQLAWVAVVGGPDGADLPAGPARYCDLRELFLEVGADLPASGDFRDIQTVALTSGTTGPSKGVLISNAQSISVSQVFVEALALTADDIVFSPFPLFHGLASRLGAVPALMAGSRFVLEERFSAEKFWRQAADCEATVAHTLFTIPPILKAMPPGRYDRSHRVRAMYNAHHDEDFEARFGARLVEAYGITETGVFIYTPYPERRLGSAGRAGKEWEVKIVDDADITLGPGEAGEIVARPKLPYIMMQGYLNKPEATVAAWRNLWFHTGDIGKCDEDGYFYFIDRRKDRIRRRGENVSSHDLETIISGHPAVAQCAALPYPADAGEDDIRIVVVLKDAQTLERAEFSAWMEQNVPRFMSPRFVQIVPSLPLTPNSKVEKQKLIADGLSSDYWDLSRQRQVP